MEEWFSIKGKWERGRQCDPADPASAYCQVINYSGYSPSEGGRHKACQKQRKWNLPANVLLTARARKPTWPRKWSDTFNNHLLECSYTCSIKVAPTGCWDAILSRMEELKADPDEHQNWPRDSDLQMLCQKCHSAWAWWGTELIIQLQFQTNRDVFVQSNYEQNAKYF